MNNNGICVSTKTAAIIGVIFVAMIIFGIVSRNKLADYAKDMKHYVEVVVPAAQARADSMEAIALAARKISDSAIAVATAQRVEIGSLKGTVRVLRGRNQSLADAALSDTNTPPAARAAIIGLTEEVDSLNKIVIAYEILDSTQQVAIANLTIDRNAEKARADGLAIVVAGIPKPPGPTTVIGIKMPHIPAWVGYTAVAVGGYYIGTQVNK